MPGAYDNLLARGRVIHERAAEVEPGRVLLASGEELAADYVVLATGSGYPFPARNDLSVTAEAQDKYRSAQKNLEAADHVLLLGAGPAGLEFASEIKAAWPEKKVVIVDPVTDILSEYDPGLREEVRRQLAQLDVQLVLGSALKENPPTAAGEQGTFHVSTESDIDITADIWFRCFGVVPQTGYVTGALAGARLANGQVTVDDTLRVTGQHTVFALGDITDLPEAKRAGSAMRHAEVVAQTSPRSSRRRATGPRTSPAPRRSCCPSAPAAAPPSCPAWASSAPRSPPSTRAAT